MSSSFRIVHARAAGIDIGSETIFVAVAGEPVRRFSTFTDSLLEMQQYLLQHKITTVAMEATGIYWYAVYDILEQAHLEVCLVNSRQLKYVPGRKSDVQDCQWLQELHTYGLLRSSFIPPEHLRTLRSYVRLRDDHIRSGAMHVQHMQKALDAMNIKLHMVISQIQGASGMRIIRSLLDGERDPEHLAALCETQILKSKRAEVIKALHGNYRAEHLFALRQAVELWEFYQQKIKECDHQIAAFLDSITAGLPPTATDWQAQTHSSSRTGYPRPSTETPAHDQRHRPHSAPSTHRPEPVEGPLRNRSRHEPLANAQALHFMVVPGSGEALLGQTLYEEASKNQERCRNYLPSGSARHCQEQTHCLGWFLSTHQSQEWTYGRQCCHRAQACCTLLSHDETRAALC